jgi:tRNA threonylcarbamoyladenosine modification (KEOPS) complex  Pcc1 subunit
MRHAASLHFSYEPRTADAIARALAPEAQQAEVPKTRGEAHASAAGLHLVVHAEDLPSLRAAVNSYCRWVEAAARAAAAAGR